MEAPKRCHFLSVGMSAIWLCLASILPPSSILMLVNCILFGATCTFTTVGQLIEWVSRMEEQDMVFYIPGNLGVNELPFPSNVSAIIFNRNCVLLWKETKYRFYSSNRHFQCFLLMLVNLVDKASASDSTLLYQKSELTLWKPFKHISDIFPV